MQLLRSGVPTVSAGTCSGGTRLALQQQIGPSAPRRPGSSRAAPQLLASRQADAATHEQPCSRRHAFGMLLAAPVFTWIAAEPGVKPARAVATTASSSSVALEEYMQLEDKGKLGDSRSLDNFRSKYGIRRAVDGRVSLRSRASQWFSIRLDMEVAGALLLRDPKGNVFAIETQDLPQVDLSDDYVVLMMFSDGAWEDQMSPVEFVDEAAGGATVQLQMTEKEFREFVGLLKDFEDAPEQK